MNKDELLRELSEKISAGEISREEALATLDSAPREHAESSGMMSVLEKRHFSVTQMLYVFGIAVVILGVGFFVAQIWDDIGSAGRIFITLGLGLAFAASGSLFFNTKPESQLGAVFHSIGGFLVPAGSLVALSEINPDIGTLLPVAVIFGIIALFYFLLAVFHKHVVLTFFTVANFTAFVYFFTTYILDKSQILDEGTVYAYITMSVGLLYLALAYAFREGWNKRLEESLNSLGALAFLGAAFSRVFDSVPWQLFFFVLAAGGMALSVYIKRRGVLIVSTMFLIAHFVYITQEYFADSIGWPLALIMLGFIFIGLGYASISINKKYISGNT